MSVQITSSTYCLCGGDIRVTASSWQAVQDMSAAFEQFHTGDGHRLFPTAADAKRARREVRP